METNTIDREKLRTAVRKLGDEYVRTMLYDAIDLLPPSKLCKLAKKYLDLRRLRPDGPSAAEVTLIEEVKRFAKASRAGEYYQSFEVLSLTAPPQEYAQRITARLASRPPSVTPPSRRW